MLRGHIEQQSLLIPKKHKSQDLRLSRRPQSVDKIPGVSALTLAKETFLW